MWSPYASRVTDLPEHAPTLPDGFEWCYDLTAAEVATFLKDRYVSDDSGNFVLEYSREDIETWSPDVIVGVRSVSKKKTLGVVCARLVNLRVFGVSEQVFETNFACVHEKLRHKKMLTVMCKAAAAVCRHRYPDVRIFTFTKQNCIPGLPPANRESMYEAHLNPKVLNKLGFQSLDLAAPQTTINEEPVLVDSLDVVREHDITFDIRFQLCPDWTNPEEWGKRLWGHGIKTYTWADHKAWVTVGELLIRHKPSHTCLRLLSIHYMTPGRMGTRKLLDWVVQKHKDTHDLLYAFPSAHTSEEVLTQCGLHAVDGVQRSIYVMNVPGHVNVVSSDYFIL